MHVRYRQQVTLEKDVNVICELFTTRYSTLKEVFILKKKTFMLGLPFVCK